MHDGQITTQSKKTTLADILEMQPYQPRAKSAVPSAGFLNQQDRRSKLQQLDASRLGFSRSQHSAS